MFFFPQEEIFFNREKELRGKFRAIIICVSQEFTISVMNLNEQAHTGR